MPLALLNGVSSNTTSPSVKLAGPRSVNISGIASGTVSLETAIFAAADGSIDSGQNQIGGWAEIASVTTSQPVVLNMVGEYLLRAKFTGSGGTVTVVVN